jgi:hypothetical protein
VDQSELTPVKEWLSSCRCQLGHANAGVIQCRGDGRHKLSRHASGYANGYAKQAFMDRPATNIQPQLRIK